MKKSIMAMSLILTVLFCSCSETDSYIITNGNDDVTYTEAILVDYSLNDLVAESDVIAEIIIGDKLRELDAPNEATFFNAKITSLLKGSLSNETIVIRQLGNSKAIYENSPIFTKGQKIIAFLSYYEDNEESFYWFLGEWDSVLHVKNIDGRDYIIKHIGEFEELNAIREGKQLDGVNSIHQAFQREIFIGALEERVRNHEKK